MPSILACRRACAVVLAVIGALAAVPAQAQPTPRLPLAEYVRRTWTAAEGLPQNSVRDIVQTPAGDLWLATSEGLARFDGARVTVVDRQSTPGLPSPNVSSVLLDGSGDLWLALKRDGVVRLRGDVIESWTSRRGLPGNQTFAIAADGGGAIWVCTDRGAARLRPGADRFEAVPLPDRTSCGSLAADGAGGMWLGTRLGLAHAAAGRDAIRLLPQSRAAEPVTALLVSRNGRVWTGTSRGVAVLEGERFTQVLSQLPRGAIVTSLLEDRSGAIWIGMLRHGLARYADGRLELLNPNEPRECSVLSLLEDEEGTLWAGLSTDGLMQLRPTPFSTLDISDGLPTDVARAVLPARDGAVWVGTAGSGLTRYHAASARTWTVADGLPSDFIFSLAEIGDGRVWIGTREGLAIATPHGITAQPGQVPGAIRALRVGRDGRLRLGSRDGAYVREADGRLSKIPGVTGVVRAVLEAFDGSWWIATLDGLFHIDSGGTRRWSEDDGLPDNDLSDLHENADGTLWVSTLGHGLFHFDAGRVTRYTSHHGLFDDTVFQLAADRRGWLWMTSNRGLFRARLDDLAALAGGERDRLASPFYGEADGLPANEFSGGASPAAAEAADGALWFASIRGAVRVDPAHVPDAVPAPPPLIEAVLVDGTPRAIGEPLAVAAGPSRIEIHYAARTLWSADRVRFRYRLVGFDQEWQEAGVRRAAYYTNLPAGAYRFEVAASRDGLTWSPALVGAAMTLEPHVYQRPAFAAALIVGLVLVMLGGVRWQEGRRAARERELEDLVARRTRELEDEIAERERAAEALEIARAQALQASELKSEFLANVSHEIRTPMNGVIGMTDLALEMPLPVEARRYLDVARSSADLLLQVINDVLDFSKIEAGHLDLHPVDVDLREEIDEIVTLMAPRAAAAGLTFTASVDDAVPARVMADPVRLRQVLLNLVGNALKFTDAGSVRVEVGAVADAGIGVELRFAVVDTGVGIPLEDQARIFEAFTQVDGSPTRRHGGTGLGLAIAARLAALMRGTLDVTSAPGGGSTFTFTARFERAGAPAGAAPAEVASAAVRPLDVLVAEDNAVNRAVVQHMLHRSGHRVSLVGTGRDAIEAVLGHAFDVVLMDVQMPEMNGLEATTAIRASEKHRRTPIVGVTAHALRGDRERCLAAGMDDYLPKPITRAELDRVLARSAPAAQAVSPAGRRRA